MENLNLYEMFKTMIRNAYNKESISDLQAIKRAIELIPMYCIMNNYIISIGQIRDLEELIDKLENILTQDKKKNMV